MRIPVISDVVEWFSDRAYWRKMKRWEALDRDHPILFADAVFGEMRYDRRLGWFSARRMWNGTEIDVHVSADWREQPDLPLAQALAVKARAFWQDEGGWRERLDAVVVRDLLALANEWQVDAGEAVVSPAQFCARIRPTSFTINSDNSFEVWFDDGDLFWGHETLVYGTMDEGPEAAEMHG